MTGQNIHGWIIMEIDFNMDIKQVIKELEEIYRTKSFNTRGLPFAKKMWRDGYNKALQDILTHFKMKGS